MTIRLDCTEIEIYTLIHTILMSRNADVNINNLTIKYNNNNTLHGLM